MPDQLPDNAPDATSDTPPAVQMPTPPASAAPNVGASNAAPALQLTDTNPDTSAGSSPQWQQAASVLSTPTPAAQPVAVTNHVQIPTNDPVVQAAQQKHSFLKAITGGQRIVTTVDPSGKVTHTPVETHGKDLLMGAVANLLSGIGDLSQNFAARRRGQAPPNPNPQLATQQADQQQAAKSQDDFDQEQRNKIRTQQVLTANYQRLHAALALKDATRADLDNEAHAHDEAYQSAADHGLIQQEGVRDSEIPALQKAGKYDPKTMIVIPHGPPVPVLNPDGTPLEKDGVPAYEHVNAISIGNKPVDVSPDQLTTWAGLGLLGPNVKPDTKFTPTAMNAARVSTLNSQASLLRTTEQEFQEVNPEFSLSKALAADPSFLKDALNLHLDGASSTLPAQLDKMGTDPRFAAAAARLRSAVGPDALKEYAAKNQTAAENADPKNHEVVEMDINGAPHKVLVSKVDGSMVKDLGAAKPPKADGPTDADTRAAGSEVKGHFKTYSDAQTQAQHILTTLDQSEDGNQVASALAPLENTLFITSAAGVKRVNQTELDMSKPGAGDLVRRVEGYLSKNITGKLPDGYVKDLKQLVQAFRDENEQSYKDKVDSVNERYGTKIKYGTLPARGAQVAKGDAAKLHKSMTDFAQQYAGKNGRIYSDDGRTWYDANGNLIKGQGQ